jgi:hypothetical protein
METPLAADALAEENADPVPGQVFLSEHSHQTSLSLSLEP